MAQTAPLSVAAQRIAALMQLGQADPAVDPKGVAKLADLAFAALQQAADYAAAGQGGWNSADGRQFGADPAAHGRNDFGGC